MLFCCSEYIFNDLKDRISTLFKQRQIAVMDVLPYHDYHLENIARQHCFIRLHLTIH